MVPLTIKGHLRAEGVLQALNCVSHIPRREASTCTFLKQASSSTASPGRLLHQPLWRGARIVTGINIDGISASNLCAPLTAVWTHCHPFPCSHDCRRGCQPSSFMKLRNVHAWRLQAKVSIYYLTPLHKPASNHLLDGSLTCCTRFQLQCGICCRQDMSSKKGHIS